MNPGLQNQASTFSELLPLRFSLLFKSKGWWGKKKKKAPHTEKNSVVFLHVEFSERDFLTTSTAIWSSSWLWLCLFPLLPHCCRSPAVMLLVLSTVETSTDTTGAHCRLHFLSPLLIFSLHIPCPSYGIAISVHIRQKSQSKAKHKILSKNIFTKFIQSSATVNISVMAFWWRLTQDLKPKQTSCGNGIHRPSLCIFSSKLFPD